MLTHEEVREALPPGIRNNLTQSLVDTLNQVSNDPQHAEVIRTNFMTYGRVLREGRFKLEDYLNAVKYVSFKMMGHNNKEAYALTFPQRYQALVAKNTPEKTIASYVAAYSKGILPNRILEQSIIPAWILNQDAYQEAINTQVEIMQYGRSEKARVDAANSLLTHLKRPEKTEIDLNIGVKETSGMVELRDMLTTLAEKQRAAIESGTPTREIAHQKLVSTPDPIDGEAVDVTPDKEDPA